MNACSSRAGLLALLLGISSIVTLHAQAPDDSTRAAALVSRLDSLRVAARIPGMSYAILRGDVILAAGGFGMANVERSIPVTAETPFNTASVSKPVAGVVALRLVEQGRLDLDRPMQEFAGFNEFCAAATAEGGIFFSDYQCANPALTLRRVLSMTANGAPGTRFLYNPPSFSWASRPMAEMAGVPYSDLVRTEVFQPAGMTHAARTHRKLPLPPAIDSTLAVPYHHDSTGVLRRSPPPPPQGDGAAGGVIASAMDLAHFDIALTRGVLLRPASMEVMWTAGRSPDGAALPYGLGWFVASPEGEKLVWHTGLWDGAYSALYLKVPGRNLTLILLANSEGLRWPTRLDEAAVERSPFAQAFLAAFPAAAGK